MRRFALVFAILAAGTFPRAVCAAPADDLEREAKRLDDKSFDVRRGAERALEAAASAALDAVRGEEAAAGRARLDALIVVLEARATSGAPTAAIASARILRRIEVVATDDEVRAIPQLLRVRLSRLLGQCVTPREQRAPAQKDPARVFFPDTDDAAAQAVYGFLPEATPVLRDLVRIDREPRRLAGAIVILSGESGGGADDETLATIARRFDADPEPLLATAPFQGTDRSIPLAMVGLALALSGRASLLTGRLATPLGEDGLQAVLDALPSRLSARGSGDVARGSFLESAVSGTVSAADALDATRRAKALGQPWLARMLARRALFLDPASVEARKLLVDVDLALGLGATARADAGDAVPIPADAPRDDAGPAKELDGALRSGSLGQRLAYRIEAGSTQNVGLTPVAIGAGVLVYGKPGGRVVVADPATGGELASVYTGSNLMPRSVAISGKRLAAVSIPGRLYLWTIGEPAAGSEILTPLGVVAGPYLAVAPASDGGFLLASSSRGLSLLAAGSDAPVRNAKVARAVRPAPVTLDLLSDGTVLWGGPSAAERIDPATGEARALVAGLPGLHVAPYGSDALAASGTGWRRLSPDGRVVSDGTSPDESRIDGIAGDPASGTIYLTTPAEVVAIAAADGSILWREPVEGSGNVVLSPGLVVVPAGAGDLRGGGRADRTLSILRTEQAGAEIFGKEARAKVLAEAIAAAEAGNLRVAACLVDPLPLDAAERLAFRRASGKASPLPMPDDEPGKEPTDK